MTENDIKNLLSGVIHPETGKPAEYKNISIEGNKIQLTLVLPRARDPFASALKKESIKRITEQFPEAQVAMFMQEPAPAQPKQQTQQPLKPAEAKDGIGKIIAVASGKGGVGKSTVTANLAATMAAMGYRVGVLDADIYGPSQPTLFGVEGYIPEAEKVGEEDMLLPAQARGVKIMSIGFFIDPSNALVWRGPMATSALKQLIHQTLWGGLDYLLIDLPPGTGDVHLTVMQELKIDGAVVVTTPQRIAVADVVRGIAMFRAEKVNIPVLGIVENMAWFTPAELPDSRYYVFGRGGGKELAEQQQIPFLGEIPLVLPEGEARDGGVLWSVDNRQLYDSYTSVAESIIKTANC